MTALIGPRNESWSDEEFVAFVRLISTELAATARDINQDELAKALYAVARAAEIQSDAGPANGGAPN